MRLASLRSSSLVLLAHDLIPPLMVPGVLFFDQPCSKVKEGGERGRVVYVGVICVCGHDIGVNG